MGHPAHKLQLDITPQLPTLEVAHRAQEIVQQLQTKQTSLAVVGLGYVGLPIALEFASQYSVVGFDIKPERVEQLNSRIDPSGELDKSHFEDRDIRFTHLPKRLADASFYVVAVPTPINRLNLPDLTPLKKATKSVAQALKKGDYVVFESTVYPGCTEEVCIPILERVSGLKVNEDFKVGYSPERINPGDKVHTLTSVKKIVSGHDSESLDAIASIYESIIEAGVHRAPTLKVAEAAKIIENTQRDVNIALMNELSMIFNTLDINTHDVLTAAGTKWNFMPFTPGLVGGHCIGVDPYYLIHKSKEAGHTPTLISNSRALNNSMAASISREIAVAMRERGQEWEQCRVLVKGITFKPNVSDIRNSKVADLVRHLKLFNMAVYVEDPVAKPVEVKQHYGIELCQPSGRFDAIVMAVHHDSYGSLTWQDMRDQTKEHTLLFDIQGQMRDDVPALNYMSL